MAEVLSPIGAKLDERVTGTGTSSNEGNQFKVGQKAILDDGGEAVYVHASAAIVASDVVGIDENFEAAPMTKAMADDGWFVGFSPDAAFSDNDFGWVRTHGTNFTINVLASCAADAVLYTTGTAGKLDDASSSQTKIDGVVIVTADGGSGSAIECSATHPKSTTF